MGLTYITVKMRKSRAAKRVAQAKFLVDSGAIFTIAPAEMLKEIGVRAQEEHTFTLADGEETVRKVGDAYFEIGGSGGYAKVIFGEEGDSTLLGTMTLEACMLILDPIRRQLKPLPMVLM
jgi:predicted aspartyl protease